MELLSFLFSSLNVKRFSFLTKVPSRHTYEKKIGVDERISEDSQSGYLEWALAEQRPVLITNDTKCASMSAYEYKFWLDMTDPKTGYIRKQGKGYYQNLESKKLQNIFRSIRAGRNETKIRKNDK